MQWNDGPLNSALARKEIIGLFEEMYGVPKEEAEHICLTIVVTLVLLQQRGLLPEIQVPRGRSSYFIGTQPLLPYAKQLGEKREEYLLCAATSKKEALEQLRQWLSDLVLHRA